MSYIEYMRVMSTLWMGLSVCAFATGVSLLWYGHIVFNVNKGGDDADGFLLLLGFVAVVGGFVSILIHVGEFIMVWFAPALVQGVH